jgi:NhaA family Na+:H+ antiporter
VLLAMTIPARTKIDEREFLARARTALAEFEGACGPASSVLTSNAQQEAIVALEDACEQALTPLMTMEDKLHGIVAFGIMPLFALVNAGVPLGGAGAVLAEPVARGIVAGLVVGKPVGILLASWLAVRGGVASLPSGASWRLLHGVSWLGGIGFTMSLFIAGEAFPDRTAYAAAKTAIFLASLCAGALGAILLWSADRSVAED